MEAKLYGQNKGGTSINGIIKDYYVFAKGRVEAGDLVEYVNGVAGKVDYGESVDTQLSTNRLSGTDMKAVAIDNNRVFIAYTVEGSSSGYTSLYGMVCTIKGATIQKGNGVQLCTGDYSGSWISAIKLDNKRIFVTHANGGTNSYLYGLICVINDTTIATIGTDTQLSTSSRSAQENSPCLLPNGNVFIAHRHGGSTGKLYGMILSINNIEIKVETDTQLLSSDYISNNISTCLLPNGNVFITHSYGSSYHIYGIVCKINNDNTIDKGTDTAIITSSNAALYMGTCGLSNGNIFIAYRYSTTYQLRGIVCSVSGTTITVGTYTSLSTIERTSYKISLCTLPNDNVLILHSYTADYHLYGMICGINGTSIIKGNDTALITVEDSGENISSTTLLNGTIFVAHQSDSNQCLNAQIFGIDYDNNIPTNNIIATEYETQVRQVTTGLFDGIAKTSGEGGDDTGHKDIVSIWTYKSNMVTGVFPLTLEESEGKKLINYRLEGNSEGLGNLDENGKYVIPIRTKYPNVIDLSVGSYPASKNGVTIDYRPSDGKLILNGTSATSTSIPIYIYQDIDSAKTYNVAITTNGYINGFTSCAGYDENGTTIYDLALSVGKTVEKSKSGFNQIQYIQFWCPAAVTFENCEVDIQIDEGDKYLMPITTNIYLDEPLRKVGNYADYIDFKTRKVVRQVEVVGEMLQGLDTPIEETISLPSIPTLEGATVLDSNVQPSNIEVEYFKK